MSSLAESSQIPLWKVAFHFPHTDQMDWLEQLGWDLKGLGELLSRRDDAVAAPMTFGMIIFIGTVSLTHFVWRHRRKGFRAYAGPSAVRRASATSIWSVSPGTLLTFRATVFTVSFWLLMSSTFYEGSACLRFFTVWNFIALVIFFALGTALSCSCCRDIALMRPRPSESHRLAAVAHHLLLEVQLPMSAMITMVVWLVLAPYDALTNPSLYWYNRYTNLTSLTMHGINFIFMLLEFGLDALHIEAGHVGLVLAWGMLYALFNGLQAYWTHDPVYFFMDFAHLKAPLVAAALSLLMGLIFYGSVLLSRFKWRVLLGRDHPKDPHRMSSIALAIDAEDSEEAQDATWPIEEILAEYSTPYLQISNGDTRPTRLWRSCVLS